MPLVIAVDGGQSSTLALVASTDGRIRGEGSAGASNHFHEPGGPERLYAALDQSINGALHSANASQRDVVAVCLGMTGADAEAAKIVKEMFQAAQVEAFHDTVTAWAGASLGEPGVVVIGGTGSVAYGQTANGGSARAGGWGYLLGDEGSAYDIGCAALKAMCYEADGRGPTTRLSSQILAHLKLSDIMALRHAVYAGAVTRPQIAGLASLVGTAARTGDPVANALLQSAGQQLALIALAVMDKLGDFTLPIFTTGGVFRAGKPLLSAFESTIHSRSPQATIYPAAFSPVVGALFLAFKGAGVTIDDPLVEKVRESLPPGAISKVE